MTKNMQYNREWNYCCISKISLWPYKERRRRICGILNFIGCDVPNVLTLCRDLIMESTCPEFENIVG